ncbi:hypothetical protein ABIE65_005478 [Constrictibacter sp. MBR-5]|uniref:hypothetical protein n=1 Tax=Constrictibacter sp. MBR-5 TaxID=3156467 RepID=UPI00339730B0
MPKTSLFTKRFSELAQQVEAIEASKEHVRSENGSYNKVDDELFLNWKVKARSTIVSVCGAESEHLSTFKKSEELRSFRDRYGEFKELRSIFLAAKEDYEGGYLNSFRNLVQAEVFGSELDQARELMSGGYISAAAVIAGTVLETTLRQLCLDASIDTGSLNKMNEGLCKAGEYNLLVQKRITALADIRNNAAHGHSGQFTQSDVTDMIAYIETFVSERL